MAERNFNTILVTGGAGFIGSNFIHYMMEKYPAYKIINLDKLTYAGNLENLRDVESNPAYKFVKGDICDQEAVEKIKSGYSVVIFPEGTRSETGEVQSFKRGAFYLAAHSGYPIVPITINGTKKVLPKGTFKLKSGTIYLHFDKPIPTDNIKSKQDELELMEKVRSIIISNQKEYN